MPMSTREMFARLIKCEAGGEGEAGMKAVATVVMNRVHVAYGEYMKVNQGNLRKVMTQRRQFTCLMSLIGGTQNPQTIWSARPDKLHYRIADWALAGQKTWNLGRCLWYMNPTIAYCPYTFPANGTGRYLTKVREHCFYNPTALYAET